MKIHLEELDKFIRTNKITVYDIFTESRKMPLYSSSDEISVEEALEKAIETFESMPSGLYGFRGKKAINSPNNSYNSVDILVGNPIESFNPKKPNTGVQRMQTFTQEDVEKAVKSALEVERKDNELKECTRMFKALEGKFEKLFSFTQDLAKDFEELLDAVDMEGIRGKDKGGITDMVKTAATTAMEHGTKSMIDRFSKYKV